ncbi:MAG: sugar-binding protein, partial [Victivallaceae bacterium]
MKWLLSCLMLALGCFCVADENYFQHGVTSEVKPWTNKPLLNADGRFHFAVLADRTGGARPGIFEDAVKKINLIQPDFVICVGDLIEGYTNDRQKLTAQRSELNAIVKQLDMRFFYVAGNHDTGTGRDMAKYTETRKLWQELYGPGYYYFLYKNALFMILHSQESEADCIGQAQSEWAVNVLKKYPDIKETFIFVHYPLWQDKYLNKYKELEALFSELSGRNHTIFAGHEHSYMKFERNKQKYFRLATTGGISEIGASGHFDHFMWVSVFNDRRPVFANIMLNGIADENILIEEMARINKELKIERNKIICKDKLFELPLVLKNPFKDSLKYKINLAGDKNWNFLTPEFKGEIPAEQDVVLTVKGNVETVFPVPQANGEFEIAGGNKFKMELAVPFFLVNNAEIGVPYIVSVPVIDGKLDDKCWQVPVVGEFRDFVNFGKSKVETKIWLAYDNDYFYCAAKCYEPDQSKIVRKHTKRDFALWNDDSMELFLDTSCGRKNYYQFIINSANAIYDSNMTDKKFNADVKSAVSFDADGWTVEMAIPWKDLK